MRDNYIISIHGLSKKFDEKKVVNRIDLNIKAGTIVGIIGRNGSGKTVLLKMIAQLYFPSEGSIEYKENLSITKDFGFLIDTGFLDNENGFNNLKILSLLKNTIDNSDIYEVMKLVKLDPKSNIKYKNYSTGMKQKLKIAQAIMEKPSVLILDEPFNGLDIESVNYFREKLIALKKNGVTIIITSHYQEDIDLLCGEVYQMSSGVLKKYEMQK